MKKEYIDIAKLLNLSHKYCIACGQRIGTSSTYCEKHGKMIKRAKDLLRAKLKKDILKRHETNNNVSVEESTLEVK